MMTRQNHVIYCAGAYNSDPVKPDKLIKMSQDHAHMAHC